MGDAAEQRVAEQRARDLTEHLQAALDAGGTGTWRWDMGTGLTEWDERLEGLFGLPPGGFDGTFDTYAELLHPEDRADVLTSIQAAIDTKSSYRIEHRVVWPDGTVKWLACAGRATIDDSGEVTGTIGCAVDATSRRHDEMERTRLADVAHTAADAERRLRERFQFLTLVNDALNASLTISDIMANVAAAAVPRLGDWCTIHVLRDGSPIPEVALAHVDPEMVAYAQALQDQFPYDPSAPTGIAHVIRTGSTVFYPQIDGALLDALDVHDEARAIIERLSLKSAISVPIIKQGRILGAMQFLLADPERPYSDDDLTLARLVAARVAVSLENRRLGDQQRLIAETLQQSLLPSELPDVPGVDIAVRYWAAGEATVVGGDFYDVFPLADDQWAIVIGDVCGTGPAAAALTGVARHTVRTAAWHGDSVTEVLESLNHAVLHSGNRSRSFCTAAYATLQRDAAGTALRLACGGHPLPVMVTSDDARTIGTPGTLLGVFADVKVHPVTVELDDGDVVVFYTDGATDVAPPHLLEPSQFTELVELAVRAAADGSAEAVADAIQDRLEQVLAFERRDDDIALLVLRT